MFPAILGLADNWIFAAIALSVAITVICIFYGLIKWNSGAETSPDSETIEWVREEDQIDEEF